MLHVLEPFGMVFQNCSGPQMTIDWIPPMINCTFLDTPLICNPDFLAINVLHTLGLPPTQDSSHHQDYEPFLGSGIPN